MTSSRLGCRIHWVEGTQCLQQPSLTVQSRMLSWAGCQLSEMRQISALLQAQRMRCLPRPASSSPAQLFGPQQQHSLQSYQPPRCLTHQLGSHSSQLRQGTWKYLGGEGKEGVLCSWQLPVATAEEGPSSCSPPGESPSSCPGMHTCTPHIALATVASIACKAMGF